MNACSFELLNSGNRQSTVTCAAGNHDGTGKRMLAVRQLQGKGTLAGVIAPSSPTTSSGMAISTPNFCA